MLVRQPDFRASDLLTSLLVILEEQARKLILANLKSGSKARLLLHADQIVMQRSTSLLVDTDPTAQKEVLSHSSDGDGDETDELHGIQ